MLLFFRWITIVTIITFTISITFFFNLLLLNDYIWSLENLLDRLFINSVIINNFNNRLLAIGFHYLIFFLLLNILYLLDLLFNNSFLNLLLLSFENRFLLYLNFFKYNFLLNDWFLLLSFLNNNFFLNLVHYWLFSKTHLIVVH